RLWPLLGDRHEGAVEILRGPDVDRMETDAQGPGRDLQLLEPRHMQRGGSVRKHRDTREAGHDLLNELELLGRDLAARGRHARDVAARPGEACDQARSDRI